MGEVIAFVSGKGGTGKTTLCAGIAIALAARGQKVLCIDCDVGLRNLDIFLGIPESGALSFWDVCRGGYPLARAEIHPNFRCLSFLTAPVNGMPEDMDAEGFRQMLRTARQDYDFVLLDGPAGANALFRMVAENADRCILVTCPDPAALRSAGRTAQALELMGKTQVKLAINRIQMKPLSAMGLTVDDMMDQVGLPLLGMVPEDPNIPLAAAAGKPLPACKKNAAALGAFDRMAQRILDIPVGIPTRQFR